MERTALKEWAVLTDAMARGEIIAMVRKGGIREQRAGFDVRHPRFLLYPTSFHEKAAELAPRFRDRLRAAMPSAPGTIRLELVAEARAVWWVSELAALEMIAGEQGLAWESVVSRFHYRGKLGLHVIAARVSRLAAAVEIPESPRYAGCVSWVRLDADISLDASTPVLNEHALAERLGALEAALGAPLER